MCQASTDVDSRRSGQTFALFHLLLLISRSILHIPKFPVLVPSILSLNVEIVNYQSAHENKA